MSKNATYASTPAERFETYLGLLTTAIGHADRSRPLRLYCAGLLMPGERKSVEPMAARLEPERVGATHQQMHHFVADAPWNDERVLAAVRDYALAVFGAHGGVEVWVVDDTGIPKKGKHPVGVTRRKASRTPWACSRARPCGRKEAGLVFPSDLFPGAKVDRAGCSGETLRIGLDPFARSPLACRSRGIGPWSDEKEAAARCPRASVRFGFGPPIGTTTVPSSDRRSGS